MSKLIVATALNFFFPGAGWLVLGERRIVALFWLAGVIGLTWVELSVQTAAPALYVPMFVSVFVLNTGFAVETWMHGRARAA